ncbi:MAG TPA: RNA methyltransferase [Usitatibacter sp.]|nr:RNA methyltransferase [Usitatibacter sp.]
MSVRIVLSRPSHPGNIGAAARAMKTMGFDDLALVSPRHFPDPDATAMAAGAADVLAHAHVFASLEAALADCALAVGFSARERELSHAPATLRDAAAGIVDASGEGRVALVFGNETSGLSNDELSRCQRLVTIPSNPAYGSLNLAAAVQVACYEVAVAASAFAAPASRERGAASVGDIDGFFAHLEAAAIESGFLDPDKPGRFMERMRRLFARTRLERQEVKLLRGLLGSLEKKRKG